MKKIVFLVLMTLMGLNIVRAQECGTVTTFPWWNDFGVEDSVLGCWSSYGDATWNNSGTQVTVNLGYGNISGWLLSQPLALPADSTGLKIYWQERRGNNSSYPSSMTLRVLVTTADSLDMSNCDTVYNASAYQSTNNFTQRSASLAAYAGQTVRVAFVVGKTVNLSRNMIIKEVSVHGDRMPIGTVLAPGYAKVGDTVNYGITLSQGDSNMLTCTWHSSLLNGTWVMSGADGDNGLNVVYTVSGIDTITVTVANAFGSFTQSAVVNVYECNTISTFPWIESFELNGSYNVCWTVSGFTHNNPGTTYNGYSNYLLSDGGAGSYLITPAVSLPVNADGLVFMLNCANFGNKPLRVLVSPTASTDTAFFTDTLTLLNTTELRKLDLSAYAGQTICIALLHGNSAVLRVLYAGIDYDTLPVIGNITIPSNAITGEAALCTATLRYGSTMGLHYTWSSAVGGTFTTNAIGDSAWLTYSPGIGSRADTITVIAQNAYGLDTMTRTLHVSDCSTVTSLPWSDSFYYGIDCWTVPEGSNWSFLDPSQGALLYNKFINSNSQPVGTDNWIISKGIVIPAVDTSNVILEWGDANYSTDQYPYRYSVLVTTSADPMDTAAVWDTVYSVAGDTLGYIQSYSTFTTRHADLSAYAGQTIHVAFRHQPYQSVEYHYGLLRLCIDNVTVRETNMPVVRIDAPAIEYGDEVTYTAMLVEGSHDNLSLSWHSTMLDSTWIDTLHYQPSTFHLIYPYYGIDTVTVIAFNNYGIDTAVAITEVRHCEVRQVPWSENFSSDSTRRCWKNLTVYSSSDSTGMAYLTNRLLISPAFDMPDNADDVYLRWLQINPLPEGVLTVVLVSPTGGMDESDFTDTLLYAYHEAGTDSLLLGQTYAGQRIRVAFEKQSSPYILLSDVVVKHCTTAPTVTITTPVVLQTGYPASITATLDFCSSNVLNVKWHSSLLDTIWFDSTITSQFSSFNLNYTTGGIDTVMAIATNAWGADTAVAVVTVVNCPVQVLPWTEDFESYTPVAYSVNGDFPQCWSARIEGSADTVVGPHIVDSYQYMSGIPDNALIMVSGGGYSNWSPTNTVVLPRFADSLHSLALAFDYRYENALYGTLEVGYDYTVGDSSVFVVVDTVVPHSGDYQRDTVGFYGTSAPADARIALRWTNGTAWFVVVVDNIEVFNDSTAALRPIVALDGPTLVDIFDTAFYIATMLLGDTTGLFFTWHSTLMDSTWTADSLVAIVYPSVGTDTLKVTATNSYGSHSASIIVYLNGCNHVNVPYQEDFESVPPRVGNNAGHLPDCWSSKWTGSIGATPYVVGDSYEWNETKKVKMIAGNGSYYGNGEALVVLPGFEYSINQLSLALDYMDSYTGTLSVGYMVDTVYTPLYNLPNLYPINQQNAMGRDTVDFSGVTTAGAHMAIRYLNTSIWSEVFIDNISVFITSQVGLPPVAALYGPTTVDAFDSVTFTATLTGGDTTGVVYSWHSTLLDSTWVVNGVNGQSVFNEVYIMAGTDTLTVTATTTFGSNTTSRIINVAWPSYLIPSLRLDADVPFYTCDINQIQATLVSGNTTGLVYTWHSSLLDSSWVDNGINGQLVYTTGGTDTITVVAANVYGSDIATAVVEVRQCNVANGIDYVSAPAASEEEFYCWKVWQFDSLQANVSTTHGRWCRFADYYHDTRPAMMSTEQNLNFFNTPIMLDDWLISPHIELPVTVPPVGQLQTITLGWNSFCENSTFRVLVSTTGRDNPAAFTDTLYVETQGDNVFNPWETHTVDLTSYAGQTVCIAFHHSGPITSYGSGSVYMDSIWIDYNVRTAASYSISLSVNDTSMGTVSGAGTYYEGSFATISAVANEGFHFVVWNDGDSSAERRFLVTSDNSFTAYFAADSLPDTVWHTVTIIGKMLESSESHPFNGSGEGTYQHGDTATLIAYLTKCTPVFYGWVVAPGDTILENTYSFVVVSDTIIIALYKDMIGIDEIDDFEFELYPNPAHSDITVNVSRPSTISVFDANGRIVIPPSKVITTLNIPHAKLRPGVYLVKVSTDSNTTVKKLIVK